MPNRWSEIPMAPTPRTIIVVPSIREECIVAFLSAWKNEFAGVDVLVIEDHAERTFDLTAYANVIHYCWADIDAEFGEQAWIMPRRTDCVRSFGYWKAWQQHPDMVVTLDDDCLPVDNGIGFLDHHWQRLQEVAVEDAWQSTTTGVKPRGYPYYATERKRRCVINHGLWTEVPDFDAPTQLQQSREPADVGLPNQVIPVGRYYPMCGMNLSFRPEIIPALYFLLMGKDWKFDRFGDIWAGLFSKKICDHLGFAVHSGDPVIRHSRASSVWANLVKEAPGLAVNEELWLIVDAVVLTGRDARSCYVEIATAIGASGFAGDYGVRLAEAMLLWSELFVASPAVDEPTLVIGALAPSGV